MKRKVLFVVHQLNLGGVQKALISALNALDYSENEVTLYVRKNRTELLPDVNQKVSRIIINQDATKYYRKPYAIWLQLLLKINNSQKTKQKLDDYIILSQMKYEKKHYFFDDMEYDIAVSYIQSYTAKFVTEKINAKRKVMFFHGSTVDEFHEVNVQAMKACERVYCVSREAREAVIGFYPEFADKIDYLENFVDVEQIRKKAEEFIPDYPSDRRILCTCGRITPDKGFDLAVSTAELLRNRGLLFKWFFVGDGYDKSRIEALIEEKKLTEFIEITGLQINPYPFIKYCDIYIQPSYDEALSISMLEAQMLCAPIVSTKTAGGIALIKEGVNGLLAEIKGESLAEMIEKLMNDSKLRKGIKDFLSKFDYSLEEKRYKNDWKKLLEDKSEIQRSNTRI